MPSATLGYKPELNTFNDCLKGQTLDKSTNRLETLLRSRHIAGPEACALATANLLSQAVSKSRAADFDNLRLEVAQFGARLVKAQPREPVIANITRRVLGLISDEAEEDRNGEDADATPYPTPAPGGAGTDVPPSSTSNDYMSSMPRPPLIRPGTLKTVSSFSVAKTKSLLHLFSAEPALETMSGSSTPLSASLNMNMHGLRTEVIDGIEEIKDEIEQVDNQIWAKAEHISPGESILVCQPSATVRGFLAKAAARRKFTVFVLFQSRRQKPELYTSFKNSLARHGVEVVYLYGSAAAGMTRFTRVVLDARTVFADGSVLLDAGCGTVAAAARRHRTTVTILGGVYKFSPEIPEDPMDFVQWGDASDMGGVAEGGTANVATVMPLTEVIPNSLVDEYVTNLGITSSASIPNIILEHYKLEDLDFVDWASRISGSAMPSM